MSALSQAMLQNPDDADQIFAHHIRPSLDPILHQTSSARTQLALSACELLEQLLGRPEVDEPALLVLVRACGSTKKLVAGEAARLLRVLVRATRLPLKCLSLLASELMSEKNQAVRQRVQEAVLHLLLAHHQSILQRDPSGTATKQLVSVLKRTVSDAMPETRYSAAQCYLLLLRCYEPVATTIYNELDGSGRKQLGMALGKLERDSSALVNEYFQTLSRDSVRTVGEEGKENSRTSNRYDVSETIVFTGKIIPVEDPETIIDARPDRVESEEEKFENCKDDDDYVVAPVTTAENIDTATVTYEQNDSEGTATVFEDNTMTIDAGTDICNHEEVGMDTETAGDTNDDVVILEQPVTTTAGVEQQEIESDDDEVILNVAHHKEYNHAEPSDMEIDDEEPTEIVTVEEPTENLERDEEEHIVQELVSMDIDINSYSADRSVCDEECVVEQAHSGEIKLELKNKTVGINMSPLRQRLGLATSTPYKASRTTLFHSSHTLILSM
jgi:hypothetical protein